MQKYSWWQAFWLSFFSRTLYQSVVRQWRGSGSFYLMLLSALVVLPLTLQVRSDFFSFVQQDLPGYLEELPSITIRDGQASTPESHPYIINEKGTKEPFIVIDTTGKYTSMEQTSAVMLVTTDRITIRKNSISSQSYPFTDLNDMTIDRGSIEEFLHLIGRFIIPFMYVILIAINWFWRFSQAMTYAFVAKWLARRKGFTLSYTSFVRVSAVALTPAMILDMLLGVVNIPLPFAGVLFLILEVMYLRFAIQSISQLPPVDPNNGEGSIIA